VLLVRQLYVSLDVHLPRSVHTYETDIKLKPKWACKTSSSITDEKYVKSIHLGVILQNDSNIHVDNNKKTDDEIRQQECNANGCRPTVAWIAQLVVRFATVIFIHDPIQHTIPSG
jgi:hypothetical protein